MAASNWCLVTSGIPQGSVLGPALFVLYINDLPEAVKSMLQMFADDTKIFCGISNECGAKQLQSDLVTLENWSETWQLTFNAKKCKVMHLGKKNIGYDYHLNDAMSTLQPLVVTHLEKDLGVYVDNCLTFSDHIQYVANKANRILSMIRRSYTFKEKKTIQPLYISLIRPQFGHHCIKRIV